MPIVLYETRASQDDEWRVIAAINPADPPGQVIDTTYGRLDVLLFGCGGCVSVVSRVTDTTNNLNAAVEDVIKRGQTEPLCRLYNGESFELEIKNRLKHKGYQARWTHYDRYLPGWTRHA